MILFENKANKHIYYQILSLYFYQYLFYNCTIVPDHATHSIKYYIVQYITLFMLLMQDENEGI